MYNLNSLFFKFALTLLFFNNITQIIDRLSFNIFYQLISLLFFVYIYLFINLFDYSNTFNYYLNIFIYSSLYFKFIKFLIDKYYSRYIFLKLYKSFLNFDVSLSNHLKD